MKQLRTYVIAATLALAPVPAIAETSMAEDCRELYSSVQKLRDMSKAYGPGLVGDIAAMSADAAEQMFQREGIWLKCATVLVFP